MSAAEQVPHPGHRHNTYRRVLDEIGGGNPAPAMSPKTRDALEIAGMIERLPDRLVGGNVYPINVRQYRMPAAVMWQWCAATGTPYPEWIKNTTSEDNTMTGHNAEREEIDALEPHMLPKNQTVKSDLTVDEQKVLQKTQQLPPPTSTRAPKRKSRLDQQTNTVHVLDAAGVEIASYEINLLTKPIHDYLVLRGLWDVLRSADDPDAAFLSLVSGDLPGRAALRGDAAWREAYALHCAESTGQHIDDAREVAALLDKKMLAGKKLNSKIVAQWEKLTGRGEDI